MPRHRSAKITGDQNGTEVLVHEHTSDSPLIPNQTVAQLREIGLDKVEWLLRQTEEEAQFRRQETQKNNKRVFIERILALIFSLIISMSGITGGIIVATMGHEWLGGIIASMTIGTLAVAYIANPKKNN